MLLTINGTDYSKKLVPDYDINEHIDYNEWTDGNGRKHKDEVRRYIGGSLNLQLSEEEYSKFREDLENVKKDKVYSISIYVTNLADVREIDAYINFYPFVKKDLTKGKKFNTINVSIEEM